jgi:hypothetical protein
VNRRDFLGVVALAACGRGGARPRIASDVAGLPGRLRGLEAALRGHGFPVDQVLRPPRPPDELGALAAGRGRSFPPELVALWSWHDGETPGGFPLFRDVALLSADEALAALDGVVDALEPARAGVTLIPFAGFEGAHYCLPVTAFAAVEYLERPVIEVFEGVTAVFASLGHLIETQTAWVEDGVATPNRFDGSREQSAWRRINPGLPRVLI